MESALKEGLEDVIREIMENINTYSRQRGRVIEYREILYGYSRVNPTHGHDLILDLLLVYKKYRGKKMTVPVRKHLYVQRSFTETRIREIVDDPEGVYRDFGELDACGILRNFSINFFFSVQSNSTILRFTDKMRSIFNDKLNKFSELYNTRSKKSLKFTNTASSDKIIFVLPLSGRYETFLRFLNNFEDVS